MTTSRGLLAGVGCYAFWGLVAIYWKQLGHVAPLELVAHRTVWSLVFLLVLLRSRGRLAAIGTALTDPRLLAVNVVCGSLLLANWLVFLWAVDRGQLLDTSLGYFLVPLFHVAAGYLFLRERPRRGQWWAIGLAAAGVVWLFVGVGRLPWVALLLVGSWGTYGLVRKRSPMKALEGLTVETLLSAPLAAGYLVWLGLRGGGALGHVGVVDHGLLLCSGWITAVPLVWFAYAAVRIPITTLGLLQYISPSLQFLLGWLVYREPFDSAQLVGYASIWAGLFLYSIEGLLARRRATTSARLAGP